MFNKTFVRFSWVVVVCLLIAGCSGAPGRISSPDVDPEKAAALAMEEFDRDGDGVLNGEELQACPALVYAMPVYDTNRDKQLSEEEVAAGIGRWATARIGAILLPFRIQLDGRPLAGAKVEMIPVSFLGGAIKPAHGVANKVGIGKLRLAPEDRLPNTPPNMPLVPPGLYRVEITHPDIEVPAKFNVDSTLGVETSVVGALYRTEVVWNLSSKR